MSKYQIIRETIPTGVIFRLVNTVSNATVCSRWGRSHKTLFAPTGLIDLCNRLNAHACHIEGMTVTPRPMINDRISYEVVTGPLYTFDVKEGA